MHACRIVQTSYLVSGNIDSSHRRYYRDLNRSRCLDADHSSFKEGKKTLANSRIRPATSLLITILCVVQMEQKRSYVYHAPLIRYYSAGTAARISIGRLILFTKRKRENSSLLFRETRKDTRKLRVTLDSLGIDARRGENLDSPVTPVGVPTDAMIASIMKSRMKSPCRARPHQGGIKAGARAKATRLLLARRRSASSGGCCGCCGHADVGTLGLGAGDETRYRTPP